MGSVGKATLEEVREAFETAHACHPKLTRAERAGILQKAAALVRERLDAIAALITAEAGLARLIGEAVATYLSEKAVKASLLEQRDLVTVLLNELLGRSAEAVPAEPPSPPASSPDPLASSQTASPKAQSGGLAPTLDAAKRRLQSLLLERMDVGAAAQLPRPELERQVAELIGELLAETKLHLNMSEQRELVAALLDEMLGLGPLEPLLKDTAGQELLATLRAYLDHNGSWETAARALGVHRHTLRNRVGRIERLTGLSLDVAANRVVLTLALATLEAT